MNSHPEPSTSRFVVSAIAVIGGLVILVIVAAILYLDDHPGAVARAGMAPEERRELLEQRRDREREELGSYGWIDEDEGRVRLPIERAMELAVEELAAEEWIFEDVEALPESDAETENDEEPETDNDDDNEG